MGTIIIRNLAVIICCALVLTSCDKKQHSLQQGDIVVQSDIVHNPVYKELDKEKNTRQLFDVDTIMPAKTSGVIYITERNSKLVDTALARIFNCQSYLKADTLQINIGISSGFVGWGFFIRYMNKKFTIKPYYETDAITVPAPPPPTFKVIEQHLTLNKDSYNPGDSVFGKVKFKITEQDGEKRINHSAEGYFRSKVVQP